MIKQILKIARNVVTKDLLGNAQTLQPGDKFKFEVEGEIKDMTNKGFNDTQKREIAEIVKDIILEIVPPIIDQKLEPLKQDISLIKSLPTIQKEIKEIKK